jgi:hypothetical protein
MIGHSEVIHFDKMWTSESSPTRPIHAGIAHRIPSSNHAIQSKADSGVILHEFVASPSRSDGEIVHLGFLALGEMHFHAPA